MTTLCEQLNEAGGWCTNVAAFSAKLPSGKKMRVCAYHKARISKRIIEPEKADPEKIGERPVKGMRL